MTGSGDQSWYSSVRDVVNELQNLTVKERAASVTAAAAAVDQGAALETLRRRFVGLVGAVRERPEMLLQAWESAGQGASAGQYVKALVREAQGDRPTVTKTDGDWAETLAQGREAAAAARDVLLGKQAELVKQGGRLNRLLKRFARGKTSPEELGAALNDLLAGLSPPVGEAIGGGEAEAPIGLAAVQQSVALVKARLAEVSPALVEVREAAAGAAALAAGAVADLKAGTLEGEALRRNINQTVNKVEQAVEAVAEIGKNALAAKTVPAAAAPAAPSWVANRPAWLGAAKAAVLPPAPPPAAGVSVSLAAITPPPVAEFGKAGFDRFLARRAADLIGRELAPTAADFVLAALVRRFDCPAVGALYVTCTDEAETPARIRFSRSGVVLMLPRLPDGSAAPVVTCNRGACFEHGSLTVAAHHFAVRSPLALVIRVQAHCGVAAGPIGRQYGCLNRYGHESSACGALAAVLKGDQSLPKLAQVAETIEEARVDAVRRCPAALQPLFMSVLQARSQVERASEEFRSLKEPGLALLLGSVSLNGLSEAAELPVILRIIDRRTDGEKVTEYALPWPDENLAATHGSDGRLRLS